MDKCVACGIPTTKVCGRCSLASYCSKECQRECWKEHKKVCVPILPNVQLPYPDSYIEEEKERIKEQNKEFNKVLANTHIKSIKSTHQPMNLSSMWSNSKPMHF